MDTVKVILENNDAMQDNQKEVNHNKQRQKAIRGTGLLTCIVTQSSGRRKVYSIVRCRYRKELASKNIKSVQISSIVNNVVIPINRTINNKNHSSELHSEEKQGQPFQ